MLLHCQRAQGLYSSSAVVVDAYLPKRCRTLEKFICHPWKSSMHLFPITSAPLTYVSKVYARERSGMLSKWENISECPSQCICRLCPRVLYVKTIKLIFILKHSLVLYVVHSCMNISFITIYPLVARSSYDTTACSAVPTGLPLLQACWVPNICF